MRAAIKEKNSSNTQRLTAAQSLKGKMVKIPEKEDDNVNKIGRNKFEGFAKISDQQNAMEDDR